MAKATTKKGAAAPMYGERTAEEKQKALATAISQIEKDFGKGTIMKMGETSRMNVSAVSTGSLSLDLALGMADFPRDVLLKSMVPNPPVRPHWRSTR